MEDTMATARRCHNKDEKILWQILEDAMVKTRRYYGKDESKYADKRRKTKTAALRISGSRSL